MVSFRCQVFVLLSLSISPGCIYIEGWDDMRMGGLVGRCKTAVCLHSCLCLLLYEKEHKWIKFDSFNSATVLQCDTGLSVRTPDNSILLNKWKSCQYLAISLKMRIQYTIAHDKLSPASLTTTGFSCLPTRTHLKHKIWHKLIFLEYFFGIVQLFFFPLLFPQK